MLNKFKFEINQIKNILINYKIKTKIKNLLFKISKNNNNIVALQFKLEN